MNEAHRQRFIANEEEGDFARRPLPCLLLWIYEPQAAFAGELAHAGQCGKKFIRVANEPERDRQDFRRILLEPRTLRKDADCFSIAARCTDHGYTCVLPDAELLRRCPIAVSRRSRV